MLELLWIKLKLVVKSIIVNRVRKINLIFVRL